MSDSDNNPVFKPNKHMLASPKLEQVRGMFRQADIVIKVGLHGVDTHDIEGGVYEMSASALLAVNEPLDSLDEQLGGAE